MFAEVQLRVDKQSIYICMYVVRACVCVSIIRLQAELMFPLCVERGVFIFLRLVSKNTLFKKRLGGISSTGLDEGIISVCSPF